MTHKQVIVVRKDLKMGKGKIGSQVAHASLAAILNLMRLSTDPNKEDIKELWLDDRIGPWIEGSFTKICLGVNSEEELRDIYNKALKAGIITVLIQDSGKTEFNGVPTYTTVAVGPDRFEKVDSITGHLPLL